MRVLPHIKRLGDCFGDFLVRETCPCGASRHVEPEALARIAGRSVTLAKLATRMRCSNCGEKVAEVVAIDRAGSIAATPTCQEHAPCSRRSRVTHAPVR